MEITILIGVGLEADTVVTDIDGKRVWLKEVFLNGRKIGVAACCPESVPCPWHTALGKEARKKPVQNRGLFVN